MKKIIIWITAILCITGITYWSETVCQSDSDCHVWCCINYECKLSFDCPLDGWESPSSWNNNPSSNTTEECSTENCDWICQEWVCVENLYWDAGISIDKDCLLNWQCSMNVYETLWIRKSNPDPSVKVFAQDIILWASMFFGTVMTILLIISGLSFVMAWYTGKSPDKAKKMMIWSIVWLLFVTFSYTIIRLIQFLATWWS